MKKFGTPNGAGPGSANEVEGLAAVGTPPAPVRLREAGFVPEEPPAPRPAPFDERLFDEPPFFEELPFEGLGFVPPE